MTPVTLYHNPITVSLAPYLLLKDLGIDFDVSRPVFEGDELLENLRKVNPLKKIPVLIIEGEAITELPAIATAIATLAPEQHILGRKPLDKARTYEWIAYIQGTLHVKSYGPYFRPHRWSDDSSAWKGIQDKAFESVREAYAHIECRLSGGYAVGGEFSFVDILLFVFYRWANFRGNLDMKDYPKLSALGKKVAQRPAIAEALNAEELSWDGRP